MSGQGCRFWAWRLPVITTAASTDNGDVDHLLSKCSPLVEVSALLLLVLLLLFSESVKRVPACPHEFHRKDIKNPDVLVPDE